jgi:hypothetical protein
MDWRAVQRRFLPILVRNTLVRSAFCVLKHPGKSGTLFNRRWNVVPITLSLTISNWRSDCNWWSRSRAVCSQRIQYFMAAYREHITVSGILGVAYATAAVFLFSFSLVQATIVAVLTWVAGMLPDLDSESGRPVRELSGVVAAFAPLLMLQHAEAKGSSR